MPKYGKHWGAENELRACAWLLNQGYEVFRNVSANGFIDVVAIKDGITRYIDVKSTAQASLNGPSSETEAVEILYRSGDEFKFRKKRSKYMTREMTPREKIMVRLGNGVVDP